MIPSNQKKGFLLFAHRLPLAGYRERFILPAIVVSDNFWWGETTRTLLLEVRWWYWVAGISWTNTK